MLFARWLATLVFMVLSGACSGNIADGPKPEVILAEKPAELLSEYGLFTDRRATVPANGVMGYDLINPLFSDFARKDRFVFVPDGEAAEWSENGVFSFPVGSVLVKSFSYPETGTIETRLLINKSDGWKAYPYVWNADRTEATYRPIGLKTPITFSDAAGIVRQISYAVPNQNQCKTCHQAGKNITPIGPKARNLGVEQVQKWGEIGLLAQNSTRFAAVPSILAGDGPLTQRARAYLDINCAHCHKSDGAASNSGLWLDWTEKSLVKLGVDKHPTAAGRGAGKLKRVIERGDPDASILAYRMASAEAGIAMPELGRALVDDKGVALINDWIADMQMD